MDRGVRGVEDVYCAGVESREDLSLLAIVTTQRAEAR